MGGRDPPKHPRIGCSAGAGQGRPPAPPLRGSGKKKGGGMSWGYPNSGACVSSSRLSCRQWGFEGPGGSFWGVELG